MGSEMCIRDRGRIVSSVSVIEIPAKSVEAISVFNPNELLVTSFYSIKDDPTRQCEEMRNLYDAGGVALVLFYVGDVIPQVSDELLQTADVMNIPLILIEDEAEYSVSYSDVIKDVMGAVFYDQASTDSFSDTVENRLKQIPYNKRSMETLLNVIAVSYTHLRAHETDSYLVCRLLLEKKKKKKSNTLT